RRRRPAPASRARGRPRASAQGVGRPSGRHRRIVVGFEARRTIAGMLPLNLKWECQQDRRGVTSNRKKSTMRNPLPGRGGGPSRAGPPSPAYRGVWGVKEAGGERSEGKIWGDEGRG